MTGPPTPAFTVTWWGHATATVDIAGRRVVTDPLLVDRLVHLRRYGVTPAAPARLADLVLISHLHGDHLHPTSLRMLEPDVLVVAPNGAERLLARAGMTRVRTVGPGDRLSVDGLAIEVLAATHDDRRSPGSRTRGPAIGFRVAAHDRSFWFPGRRRPTRRPSPPSR